VTVIDEERGDRFASCGKRTDELRDGWPGLEDGAGFGVKLGREIELGCFIALDIGESVLCGPDAALVPAVIAADILANGQRIEKFIGEENEARPALRRVRRSPSKLPSASA
jgi:hypothetical protein